MTKLTKNESEAILTIKRWVEANKSRDGIKYNELYSVLQCEEGFSKTEAIYIVSKAKKLPELKKWIRKESWQNKKPLVKPVAEEVVQKVEVAEESQQEIIFEEAKTQEKVELSTVLHQLRRLCEETRKEPVKLLLDWTIMSDEGLTNLFKGTKDAFAEEVLEDLIRTYPMFQIVVFHSDIVAWDKARKCLSDGYKIARTIAQLVDDPETRDYIQLVQEDRPGEQDIVEYCKQNACVLVSGNEVLLCKAMLAGVPVSVPQYFKDRCPRLCTSDDESKVLGIDTNISLKFIDCARYNKLLLPSTVAEELSYTGVTVREAVYYGEVRNVQASTLSNDEVIAEFYAQNPVTDFYTQDHVCSLLARSKGVEAHLVREQNSKDSLGYMKIRNLKKATQEEGQKDIVETLKEKYRDKTIAMSCGVGMKQNQTVINEGSMMISFENSFFRRQVKPVTGGYVHITAPQAINLRLKCLSPSEVKF